MSSSDNLINKGKLIVALSLFIAHTIFMMTSSELDIAISTEEAEQYGWRKSLQGLKHCIY